MSKVVVFSYPDCICVRRWFVNAIRQLCQTVPERAMDVLVDLVDAKHAEVRLGVAKLIGKMTRPVPDRGIAVLETMLLDDDNRVRAAAENMLEELRAAP